MPAIRPKKDNNPSEVALCASPSERRLKASQQRLMPNKRRKVDKKACLCIDLLSICIMLKQKCFCFILQQRHFCIRQLAENGSVCETRLGSFYRLAGLLVRGAGWVVVIPGLRGVVMDLFDNEFGASKFAPRSTPTLR